MVVAGASTIVPLTPGGAGTQQVLLTLALHQTASAAAVVSGMQAGITAAKVLLGIAAAMAVCRTVRPVAALRASLAATRAA